MDSHSSAYNMAENDAENHAMMPDVDIENVASNASNTVDNDASNAVPADPASDTDNKENDNDSVDNAASPAVPASIFALLNADVGNASPAVNRTVRNTATAPSFLPVPTTSVARVASVPSVASAFFISFASTNGNNNAHFVPAIHLIPPGLSDPHPTPIPVVTVFGCHGAGKTTLASALAARHPMVHFSIGQLLRDLYAASFPPIPGVSNRLNAALLLPGEQAEDRRRIAELMRDEYMARLEWPPLAVQARVYLNRGAPIAELGTHAMWAAIRVLSARPQHAKPFAVLLDGDPGLATMAAQGRFGCVREGVAVHVRCEPEVAKARWMERRRDVASEEMWDQSYEDYTSKVEGARNAWAGRLVEVDAEGGVDDVFANLESQLRQSLAWQEILATRVLR